MSKGLGVALLLTFALCVAAGEGFSATGARPALSVAEVIASRRATLIHRREV